ncbi:MAG: serine O-acetyltransferase EpsC [Planctomycetota bacterium]
MVDSILNRKKLLTVVKKITGTYEDDKGINHLEGLAIPDRNVILDCLNDLMFILFPGFTDSRPVSHVNVEHMVGDLVYEVFRKFSSEIETSFHYQCKLSKCGNCDCGMVAENAAMHLIERIPRIREILKTDVQAAFDHDPAANSFDEIILSYPGIKAVAMQRISHELYRMKVPLIPRIINEYAHAETGIDIHPGAQIGEYFFIDHGTGVVIGETTVIGKNVCIYHGVTLGAQGASKGQALHGVKRHPTIKDDVVIYPGATILGGDTVVGKGCTIGGNVLLSKSVPAFTLVTINPPELVFLDKKAHQENADRDKSGSQTEWSCPAREFCMSEKGAGKSCTHKCTAAAAMTVKKITAKKKAGKKKTAKKKSGKKR